MPELEDFMSVSDVAQKTGLDESTIRHHIREGRLKARRLGKRGYIIDPADYETWNKEPENHKRGPKHKNLGA